MRLFIALCFAPAMVEALDALAADLQREAGGGRRTRRENLHLTLAFLGEQQSSAPWAEAVAAAEGCAMRLESGRLGCFRRSGGATAGRLAGCRAAAAGLYPGAASLPAAYHPAARSQPAAGF